VQLIAYILGDAKEIAKMNEFRLENNEYFQKITVTILELKKWYLDLTTP
jgi:hypothetical protein